MTTSRLTDDGKTLVLEYYLFDLPTAQHKAGLAGFLMLLASMKARGFSIADEPTPSPTSVQLSLSADDLQAICDDLYAARWAEVESGSKWKGKEPKRIETKQVAVGGKTKTENRFVYDAVQPLGAFLQTYYPDGDGLWVKLWRDMVWNTLRSRPKSRGVYEETASGGSSSLGAKWWKTLVTAAKDRTKGKLRTQGFGSSNFIGAQDENAERVPFEGVAEENFLLQFWPVATRVFAPKRLQIDRNPQRGLVSRRDDAGYLLVIPEPAHLKYFVEDAIRSLRSQDAKPAGYRPAAAVIDVPAEGGMEYLFHLGRAKVERSDIADSISAVELYHLEKRGNNVRLLAAVSLAPQPGTVARYEAVRGQWANPLFKATGLTNLLADTPWHRGFDSVFVAHPWQVFVYVEGQTPREIRFFGRDVRKMMMALQTNQRLLQNGGTMGEEGRVDQLSIRIYQLVSNYVNRRTEEKSGRSFKDLKRDKGPNGKERVLYPAEYREAREKVCADAFLGIRGRRDKDFVEYFTGTFCSVPQFLPEAEFVGVAQALTNDWETVKTLSMLALSAASYLSGSTDDPKEANP